MFARVRGVVLSAGLLALVGCGPPKLDEKGTATLVMGDYKLLELQRVAQPQKITVEVDATEPVNVYVIDLSIKDKFEMMSPAQQEQQAKYGKKLKVKKDTVTADVPANTAVVVAIGGGEKKSEVTYLLSNRK